VSATPTTETKRELAASLRGLGNLAIVGGNTDEAINDYKQSIATIDELLRSEPQNHDLEQDQSVNYQRVADALHDAGRNAEEITWLNKDLSIAEQLAAADKKALTSQRDLASSIDRLATAQDATGDENDALLNCRRALGILEAVISQAPNAPDWQRDAAAIGETLGKLLSRRGNDDEAVGFFRRSLALREGLAASFEESGWQLELEAAYRRVSELMWKMDRLQDASEIAEQYLLATALSSDNGADKPSRVGRALGTLCWSALLAGNLPRAIWAGEQGILLAPNTYWIKINYAHALMFSGEKVSAREIYLSGLGKDPADVASWKKTILADFAFFKTHNMSNGLIEEIAQRLGSS
jgi:tetratricopeptide (TPR) repeat protein